jgi:hypothetical protein
MTTPELVLVITTTGGIVLQLANAIVQGWGRRSAEDARSVLLAKQDMASDKLDAIHDLTDGHLSRVTKELEAQRVSADEQRAISKRALERIDHLETLLRQSIAKQPGP